MSKARDIADLDFNSVDLDGGTIDGATISTSDITVTSGKTLDVSAGTLTLANNQISGDKIEGGTVAAMTITSLSGTLQTAAQPNITSLGTVDITGVVTANAGVVVDQLTIDGGNITSSSGGMRISGADDITVDAVGDVILSCDGDQVKFDDGTSTRFTFNLDSTPTMGMGTLTLFENEIDVSSGNLTLDVAGDIVLDTDGADVRFKDAGTEFYKIRNESGVVQLVSTVSDSDIHIVGKDGNSAITALSLDMSAAGAATFNSTVSGTIATFSGDVNARNFTGVDDGDTYINFPGSNVIKLNTAGTERMRIDSSGHVSISDGNLIVASGHGIDFSATGNSGGTLQGELLDDYERGIFTPVFTTDGNDFSNNSVGTGQYSLVGTQCTVSINCVLAGATSGGTGNVVITGLPFTVGNAGYGVFAPGRITLNHSLGYIVATNVGATSAVVSCLRSGQNPISLLASEVNGNGTPFWSTTISYRIS